MDDDKLLLEEYKHFAESFWRNEEVGEKRVNFFITISTAILGGIAALYTSNYVSENYYAFQSIGIFGLSADLALGIVTYIRIMRRNKVSDEYKKILRHLRDELAYRSNSLHAYSLPFDKKGNKLPRGGLTDTMAILNSIIIAAMVSIWSYSSVGSFLKWYHVLLIFLTSFGVQWGFAHFYRQASSNKEKNKNQDREYVPRWFRAGVGAVILNRNNNEQVLAFERKDSPGIWQFPQGGIERGEKPIPAVYREIEEETGIQKEDLELLSSDYCLTVYELPESWRNAGVGRGQVHQWYFFQLNNDNVKINLGIEEEFKDHQWMSIDALILRTTEFREGIYKDISDFIKTNFNGP